MSLFSRRTLAGIFTAAAILTGIGTEQQAQARYVYGTGTASNGDYTYYNINLKDRSGQPIEFRLTLPETDQAAFREQAVSILKDYVASFDMDHLDDFDGSAFSWMVDRLAKDSGMDRADFAAAIGLAAERLAHMDYQRERSDILGDYQYIKEFEPDDVFFAGWALSNGDKEIAEINAKLEAARDKYPGEPDFVVPPVTPDDMLNMRKKLADLYVKTGLKFIGALDRREPGIGRFSRDIDQIVHAIYWDRFKPADAQYDYLAGGEPYNRQFPAMIDRSLEEHGCTDQCREDFYKKLINFHNLNDRTDPIVAAPPAINGP